MASQAERISEIQRAMRERSYQNRLKEKAGPTADIAGTLENQAVERQAEMNRAQRAEKLQRALQQRTSR